jgi:hypothetical protein
MVNTNIEKQIESGDVRVIQSLNGAINEFENLTPKGKEAYLKMMTPESVDKTRLVLESWLAMLPKE